MESIHNLINRMIMHVRMLWAEWNIVFLPNEK